MPLNEKELGGAPIYFLKPGEVHVLVGPCTGQPLSLERIPMDGRHYQCAGKIILKNGLELRANFQINTHTFDFLERGSVRINLGDFWYSLEEKEFYKKLGINQEDAIPFRWLPDKPLEYHKAGPYPMKWPE